MAVQVKARASDLYEQDLYAWSKAQADLLRAGRFAELENVMAEHLGLEERSVRLIYVVREPWTVLRRNAKLAFGSRFLPEIAMGQYDWLHGYDCIRGFD